MREVSAIYGVFVGMLLLSAMPTAFLVADEGPPEQSTPEQIAFFETRIRPVLVEHCYECHSADSKKLKGGLRLDTKVETRTGGETGPAVVPGRADESLLLEAIRYESFEMPPRGKLPASVIADFEKWIALGAADPRTEVIAQSPTPMSDPTKTDHWAFHPIQKPTTPIVADTAWPKNGVDRFVLRKLEENGLGPAPDADRYSWLRRVSLDLTGLPPTMSEIGEFISDKSPTAHETVVDRLLSSRAYGERWARHWLDLVGYADQIGTSNSVFAEHAWRYRDYLIDSINSDMPFDRFIREQIAGDLLEYSSPEVQAAAIIATGFLVLGDLEIVEADKAKMRVDIVDQQVVKTSKTFLGLTVGCARCHDHKFDPVSQRDYYAIAGFFFNTQSVYKTDRGVWSDVVYRELPETDNQLSQRNDRTETHSKLLADWKAEKTSLEAERSKLDEQLAVASNSESTDEQKQSLKEQRGEKQNRINELNRKIVHGEFFSPKVPRTYGVKDLSECADMRITIRGNPHALGDVVPRGYVAVAASGFDSPISSADGSGRLELANWIASPNNPLTSRVTVNRIWQKLFGEGLVGSVDYFGVRGEKPTHPALLDYLASTFTENGWSRKELIRELVLSRTYRMSSAHHVAAHQTDPSNKLLWRMSRRRLDAEALRDTMLAICGQLQPSNGGPALPLEFAENVGGIDPKDVNPPSFSLRKYRPDQLVQRTIYLPVVRSTGQPTPVELRDVFDFPQPAQFMGKRPVTAVPTQALFLMNSDQVKKRAELLALRVQAIADHADTKTENRVQTLWLLVLNRPPTADEKTKAGEFLTDGSLTELCHALLATNEFLMTL